MSLQTPVAFCVFNRPDLAGKVFAEIRRARPRKLYLFSDGPRPNREQEAEHIAQSRQLADQVDWDCELHVDFLEKNLGCKRRISSGISWVLEREDRLIFLEDDCLPSQSFFPFCERLLDRYENDPLVMAISGDNFQDHLCTDHTYYFSKYAHCWGWATWRRAWAKLDLELDSWPLIRDSQRFEPYYDSHEEALFWRHVFDTQSAGKIDSWAFPWMYSCWLHNGLVALPQRNLISNIGFGEQATHTTDASPLANLPRFEIYDWSDPTDVVRNCRADEHSFEKLFRDTIELPRRESRVHNFFKKIRFTRRSA